MIMISLAVVPCVSVTEKNVGQVHRLVVLLLPSCSRCTCLNLMSPTRTRPLIAALLIDLSGTLHIGSSPTPDAARAVQRLREAKFPFRFCSNTSKESRSELCSRLDAMGIRTQSEGEKVDVWTSLVAVRTFLQARGLKRFVF
jgi:Haloacid dehalogenase-like hydrolase